MSAFVAGDTICKIRDAFADMLFSDVRFGMLMAAIAGILPPVVRRMASGTGSIVIFVQNKKTVMIDRGRFPAILTVALRALCCRGRMVGRSGCCVT
jgi:hypothetical protein